MSRSKWKSPYIESTIWHQIHEKKKHLKIFSRNSYILPQFINLNFKVHNGKSFINLSITKNMIGYKFGEFVPTRKKFSFKKNK
jgi:small subunit ribosomal protein S19